MTTAISPATRIPPDEIGFHPHSFCDPVGRLFRWRGEIYRGVTSSSAAFVTDLFRRGIVAELVEHGLMIETKETFLSLDGFDLVLHHRKVDFVSYPNEWCAPMLKDALLHQCDLLLALAPYGLTLKDAHPWNLTFEFCKPLQLDFGSITPLERGNIWRGYDNFCRFGLYPLLLMAHGHDRIGRLLMCEDEGVTERELHALSRDYRRIGGLLAQMIPGSLKNLLQRFGVHPGEIPREDPVSFFEQMRQQIAAVQVDAYSSETPNDGTVMQQGLEEVLSKIECETLFDVGGSVSSSAPRASLNTVVVDSDPRRIEGYYQRAGRRKILPLVIDIKNPPPTRGIDGHSQIAATDRLCCDLVTAGSVLEPLTNRYQLTALQIVTALAAFSKKYLLLKFPSSMDRPSVREDFYNALTYHFQSVDAVGPRDQTLFLCRKM